MTNFTAKILRIEIDEAGMIVVAVEITNKLGISCQKAYNYYTTQIISFDNLKKRIATDIVQDLEMFEKLSDIGTHVGEEFAITL